MRLCSLLNIVLLLLLPHHLLELRVLLLAAKLMVETLGLLLLLHAMVLSVSRLRPPLRHAIARIPCLCHLQLRQEVVSLPIAAYRSLPVPV